MRVVPVQAVVVGTLVVVLVVVVAPRKNVSDVPSADAHITPPHARTPINPTPSSAPPHFRTNWLVA